MNAKTRCLAISLLLALAAGQDVQASDAAAGRVFDVHVHLWNGEASVKEYLGKAREAGMRVDRIGAIHGGNLMAREGQLEQTRTDNDALLALVKAHPALVAIATVHPYDGEAALKEVDRLAALGVRAIKLHSHTQGFDPADPRVLALCKHAGDRGLVVLMDNANIVPGDSQKLFNLALQTPKTHYVFNHLGGLDFRFWSLMPLVRTAENLVSDNIHFDISAIVVLAADSPIEAEFVWTMRNVGMDNLLLGSDFPQLSLKQTLDALDKLDLTDEEKQKIKWGNAERLLLRPLR